ncbi:maturation protein [ssRNA phage Gerhypos.4_54]|uniref:Maturation protein n=3 Tax=Leviviricetes TaxID=2842243 RepID=A0A8S5L0R2_9VIRU|nr:maturation protein [ssRNA phage Gerhypos.4_54]QDH88730.1 MAG: hypothetical protein H4Bulk47296_000003 [Leviviridae sp.]DAD51494.1 TPA_asm: maturation protein [ssRNA phage Gerhypos.4_54]
MGGYLTQRRYIPQKIRCSIYWASNGVLYDFGQVIPLLQETYSYRSELVAGESPTDGIVLEDGSQASGLAILKNAMDNNNFITPFDNGHEFVTTKQYPVQLSHEGKHLDSGAPFHDVVYRKVDLIPSRGHHGVMPPIDLNVYGTQAIHATLPAQPQVSISSILAQFKSHQELPGFIFTRMQAQTERFISLGARTTLNVEYGIRPFLKDVEDLLNVVRTVNKAIKQFQRDGHNGRTVRRTWALPEFDTDIISDQTISEEPSLGPYFQGYFGSAVLVSHGNTQSYTRKVHRKIRFSAEYQYTLPDDKSWNGRMDNALRNAEQLLGLGVTLETVWQLTPWTWLSDWFVDIGPILGNASALGRNGLIIRYAYIMCNSLMEEVYSSGDSTFRGNYNPGTVYANFLTRRKERRKASPFGFGLTPGDFSPEQWLILAALGITNGPSKLRVR